MISLVRSLETFLGIKKNTIVLCISEIRARTQLRIRKFIFNVWRLLAAQIEIIIVLALLPYLTLVFISNGLAQSKHNCLLGKLLCFYCSYNTRN